MKNKHILNLNENETVLNPQGENFPFNACK